jgi:hypothetical protein
MARGVIGPFNRAQLAQYVDLAPPRHDKLPVLGAEECSCGWFRIGRPAGAWEKHAAEAAGLPPYLAGPGPDAAARAISERDFKAAVPMWFEAQNVEGVTVPCAFSDGTIVAPYRPDLAEGLKISRLRWVEYGRFIVTHPGDFYKAAAIVDKLPLTPPAPPAPAARPSKKDTKQKGGK